MDAVLREIRPEEYEAFQRVDGTAFSYVPTAESMERQRPFWDTARKFGVFEADRDWAVSANLGMHMTVPGGNSVAMAGVTAVGVLPTHRRQGLLTSMMHHIFEDARAHDEPLAGLWASESIIYGRFGYGLAIEHQWWEIERRYAEFASAPPTPGTIRMVLADEARPGCEQAWASAAPLRPGMSQRDAVWWNRRFDQRREDGPGTPQFYALYEEGGRCDGYVMYRVKGEAPDGIHSGELTVVEFMAATDAAHTALWRFIFSIDLVKTVRAANRPVDDPVQHMLADSRRLVRPTRDAIWLRLVDAPRALEARAYVDGRLVIDLRDEFCPWNAGRYLLESDGTTASCTPTTIEADLVLPAASLAAVYLGGTRPSALARAGRAEERRPGALRLADAMFAAERAPWSPEHW